MNIVIPVALLACLAAACPPAQAQACGSLQNHYGPYDYRKEKFGKLPIVENAHFTPVVEALIRGSSSYLGDDLSYTLRTSPNHHRALLAVMRFAERSKTDQPPHTQYSVACYFDRAIRFQPDDTVVRALYAQYLNKRGRRAEGVEQLKAAVSFAKDNPLSHYNIGLVFFELEAYDDAVTQAHTAIALGMPADKLVEQLKARNRWREAAPPPAMAAASAPDIGASAPQ